MTERLFTFYDACAKRYGITVRQVSAIVKKYNLIHRRIYGKMAVESAAFVHAIQSEKETPTESLRDFVCRWRPQPLDPAP